MIISYLKIVNCEYELRQHDIYYINKTEVKQNETK